MIKTVTDEFKEDDDIQEKLSSEGEGAQDGTNKTEDMIQENK